MTRIETFSGATLSLSFSCLDENGDPFNLTGYSARGMVRPYAASSTETLNLSPSIPTPANGIISISKTDEQTDAVDPGDYVWGVVLDGPGGTVIPVTDGTIKFRVLIPRPA